MSLAVSVDVVGDECVIRGRLTEKEVIELWPQRHQLIAEQALSLNLSELEYSDSAGVAFLIELWHLRSAQQRPLTWVAPSPQLSKLLSLYDLESQFHSR
ncbi:lipid asymmetry maintenance protein MlaB [Shewanella sp. NIFS-20-20]|uniref:STAS domain-containing protein n=1 Tax=Shewanella sp. NIFS-20-20 TaxID=2853806 RepID=UPI001C466DD0|nr:STAS domain-containing protein [Shewanella sp. NIFS-20-20]MBV7316164.1 STAS domain-containing protein [Shewanella sp. NIFS-20-20]